MYANLCMVAEAGEDGYNVACLMMVFIAVAIPKLARSDFAFYKANLEGGLRRVLINMTLTFDLGIQ